MCRIVLQLELSMTDSIIVTGHRYYEFRSWMSDYGGSVASGEGGLEPNPTLEPGEGGGPVDPLFFDSEDRSFLAPTLSGFDLTNTAGLYVNLNGRNVLFVIDKKTIFYGSEVWQKAVSIIDRLTFSFDLLNAAARAAINALDIVIFSLQPNRSFADVFPRRFFYDVSEFYRSDGSLISDAFGASNSVHDANHILLYDQNLNYVGHSAEVASWQLQVDNSLAFGLQIYETSYLQSLIDNPSSQDERLQNAPY